MSAETKAAMERAIEAHIADEAEQGAIVTGFVLHAAYLNTDMDSKGATGYFAEFADGQAYHVGLGLAVQLVNHYNDIFEEDDDDD